jgi:hypothetical protein
MHHLCHYAIGGLKMAVRQRAEWRRLSFTEITAAAETDNGFPFFSISLLTMSGSKVRVSGIKEGGGQ